MTCTDCGLDTCILGKNTGKAKERHLFNGFSSHWVDEADHGPVQDDGVDRAQALDENGLLRLRVCGSFSETTVLLFLRLVVVGHQLVGHTLLQKRKTKMSRSNQVLLINQVLKWP